VTIDLLSPDEDFMRLGCGGYVWLINWVLKGADAGADGAIIQKVEVTVDRTTCSGADTSWQLTYWEAFKVKAGKFAPIKGIQLIPPSDGPDGHKPISYKEIEYPGGRDKFSQPSNPNSRGRLAVVALAKFVPNWQKPNDMKPKKFMKVGNPPKNLTPAGDLPATQTAPAGWNDNDAEIRRAVRATWNCCDGEKARYAYGWGAPLG
jgi:hypothetical protein